MGPPNLGKAIGIIDGRISSLAFGVSPSLRLSFCLILPVPDLYGLSKICSMQLVNIFVGLACALQAAAASCKPPSPGPNLQVKVKNGTYVGVHNKHYNVDYFLGMPFAKPPVGDLRLAQPVSLDESFTGTRNANELSPQCIQFRERTAGVPQSEDCLKLNVYRPSGYEHEPLPVAVWIYGGSWIAGSNRDQRLNLTFIVNESVAMGKPMIAVAINYRLNGFGFLDSKPIREQNLTNIGLQDQRMALRWVQENIAAFGGDRSRVTIWGQSVGAASVGMHLLAYGGRDDGLFQAAIAQSGSPAGFYQKTPEDVKATWESIVNKTGCSDATDPISCLRGVSTEGYSDACNATASFGAYQYTIDGDFLPDLFSKQLNEGKFVKVPLLIGTNTDEGTSFVTPPFPDEASFIGALETAVLNTSAHDTAIPEMKILYPDIPAIDVPHSYHGVVNDPDFGPQYKRAATMRGDLVFHGPRRLTTQAWSNSDVPVYSYRFDQWPIAGIPDTKGTNHAAEVPLVMHNVEGVGYTPPAYPQGNAFAGMDDSFYELSKLMSKFPLFLSLLGHLPLPKRLLTMSRPHVGILRQRTQP